jgi:SagB-type dehydrogenase family enzyme
VIHPYTRGPAYAVEPVLAAVLHRFSTWTSAADYARTARLTTIEARRQLDRYVAAGILERRTGARTGRHTVWDQWGEAAGFLHFSTRDREFEQAKATRARVSARAEDEAPPPSTKEYGGLPRIALPTVTATTRFDVLLKNRRTWRQFGTRPPGIRDLAAVLGLTFRVQRWLDLGAFGRTMLRSSPSGGARHPTEAYVLVRRITGVPSGVYYYAPGEHALVLLKRRQLTGETFTTLLGGQSWYAGAAALVCMSSVFARTAWVYRTATAYKSLLLEAGHFCQTFCLACTARKLAPFCTSAFAASRIERLLGLEAAQESVMYVAGFGARPHGVRWAPLPSDEDQILR